MQERTSTRGDGHPAYLHLTQCGCVCVDVSLCVGFVLACNTAFLCVCVCVCVFCVCCLVVPVGGAIVNRIEECQLIP